MLSPTENLVTERLIIAGWQPILADPQQRATLEIALEDMLTPAICARLPLNMDFPGAYSSIAAWITDRDGEAQIVCAHARSDGRLIGLALLAQPEGSSGMVQLGYFLGEREWGQGLATEFIGALVAALVVAGPLEMAAYADGDNLGSLRVLEKSGFVRQAAGSTAERVYFELSRG